MRILSNLNEKICSNRRIYLQIDEKKCRICVKNETNEIYEFVQTNIDYCFSVNIFELFWKCEKHCSCDECEFIELRQCIYAI